MAHDSNRRSGVITKYNQRDRVLLSLYGTGVNKRVSLTIIVPLISSHLSGPSQVEQFITMMSTSMQTVWPDRMTQIVFLSLTLASCISSIQ